MASYGFTTIKYPSTSINDIEAGIDDSGMIVGNGQPSNTHGYLVNAPTFTSIDYPGAIATRVDGISAGRIFGAYEAGGTGHGFVMSGGVYSSFDVPVPTGYFYIHPEAVNAAGTYVGYYSVFVGVGATMQQHAFTLSRGVFTPFDAPGAVNTSLSGIDDAEQAVGTLSGSDGVQHGFVLQPNGTLIPLNVPGASSTSINGVTAGGLIYGTYTTGSVSHGFVYDGSFRAVDVPGATSTYLEGADATGAAFGEYTTAGNSTVNGFVSVGGVVSTLNAPGAYLTQLTGRNASGQVVGYYYDGPGGAHGFEAEQLSPVYRFFDTSTGDHFYTTDAFEKASIQANLPQYQYEGAQWSTPDKGPNTSDVYRFFDTGTATHFFTTSATERDHILATLPNYHYEGVAFQAYANSTAAGPGAVTLERFFNTQTGLHHFSASADETAYIRSGGAGPGWTDEGPGFVVHTPTADLLHV